MSQPLYEAIYPGVEKLEAWGAKSAAHRCTVRRRLCDPLPESRQRSLEANGNDHGANRACHQGKKRPGQALVPKESFDFLGYTLGLYHKPSTGQSYPATKPSTQRMKGRLQRLGQWVCPEILEREATDRIFFLNHRLRDGRTTPVLDR